MYNTPCPNYSSNHTFVACNTLFPRDKSHNRDNIHKKFYGAEQQSEFDIYSAD